ncbi:MAG: YlmH/Sll1252 family protein [Lachnospiraceae bacterium]|nr:YlmH/Sll1252 family protein [Lachnospiraceae bacterium]
MKAEELLEKRFLDLAEQSYQQGRYTFSNFLDLYEQSIFSSLKRKLAGISYECFGGYEDAERVMVRFGSKEELSYTQDYPILLLHVTFLSEKYADTLSHRDYLGSLMNLGIERNMLGDILVMEQEAYVFVKDQIGPFLMQEWNQVRHTMIHVEPMEIREFHYEPRYEIVTGFCPSLRVDVLTGLMCRLSRKESVELIKAQKVFVNSCLVKGNGQTLKEGDILSVRGFGKAIFDGVTGQSKKGRFAVQLRKYI